MPFARPRHLRAGDNPVLSAWLSGSQVVSFRLSDQAIIGYSHCFSSQMGDLMIVISGVSIFVIGQILIRFFLDPIQEQRKIIGEIIYSQIFYDNALPSLLDAEEKEQIETINEARKRSRELSGKLLAVTNSIPCYWILAFMRFVPERNKAFKAAELLLDVSDELGSSHNAIQMDSLSQKRFEILKFLNVKLWKALEEFK